MATEPGSFERIALLFGDALAPLAQRLAPAQLGRTMATLGLRLPDSVFTSALRAAVGAAAAAAGELPGLVADLTESIDVDAGGIQIGADAVRLAEKIAVIVDSAATIAEEVGSLPTLPGLSQAELDEFAAGLPGRLLEMVLIDHLQQRLPTLTGILSLIGALEDTTLNVGSHDSLKPSVAVTRLRFDRLGALFTSPDALLTDLYGWGQPDFDAETFLQRLADLLAGIGLPVSHGVRPGTPPRRTIEMFIASIAATAAGVQPPGLELQLQLMLGDGFAFSLPIAPGLEVAIAVTGTAQAATSVLVQPPANVTMVPPSGEVQGRVRAGLAWVPPPGETVITLLGVTGGTRLSAQRIELGITASTAWDGAKALGDIGIEGRIEGGRLEVSLADADSFIGELLGQLGIDAEFELGIGWSAGGGLYFTGSGGLEIQVPTHIALGPVEITAITMGIAVDGATFPVDVTANLKGLLGPVTAVVEEIGTTATVSFPENHDGNLGFMNVVLTFKPPTGVGLSVDAGVVTGGGYLFIDTKRGEYAGVLELDFAGIVAIRAIGLITTKNPDGSPGFSLLILMSVEFGSGIQLGFGFTLLAVGGLVGLNRTMNLQALTEGVRSGAVESVMFPQDIVANAPRILSDLRAFFPTREGTFLVGPMVKLGWGTPTLVSVSLGVIIEIPGNIAIVGVLKLALPDEDAALIVLQVNFIGAIEFDKERLYFFASLYESRVLFMTIEGEMGLLMAWGEDAEFLFTVGGFHPRFTPPQLPFPTPKRVVVSIIDTDYARISVSGYFAVTSNTVQFGSRTELYFGFSAFSVEGHIGFDALFQFSPFHFIIEISASVSLKAFGVGVFGIRLRLELSGPTPWRAHGTGSISFLFFEISADFDITWGDTVDTALEPADVLPLLTAALAADSAWTAQLPADSQALVTLRSLPESEALVLHPIGTLQVRQRAIPLDLTIAKVGNQKVRDANRFGLGVTGGTLVKGADLAERFAMAQFLTMDDAAKLSRPAFEPANGGVELAMGAATAGTARTTIRTVRFEQVVIDSAFRRRVFRFQALHLVLFDHLINGAAITQSVLSAKSATLRDPHADAIAVTGEQYAVASTATNAGTAVFGSQAAALDHLAGMVAGDPNLVDALHVIPVAELNGATA